jgi:hypothetical protein
MKKMTYLQVNFSDDVTLGYDVNFSGDATFGDRKDFPDF